jgi:periplasmic protein TonB
LGPADILSPETSVQDRLQTTVFLTTLFHVVLVLGVTFGAPPAPDPGRVPTLDVLLVSEDMPASERNDQARYLAQRTQEGAGNMDKQERSRMPSANGDPDDSMGEIDGTGRATALAGPTGGEASVLAAAPGRGELVYMADANEGSLATRPREMHAGAATPMPSATDDTDLRLKGPRSRELLVTASTRESRVAVYLDSWRRKVERVGTLHFPDEARRRNMNGSPVLEVVLRADGRLAEVWVRRSSGHVELDQAAIGVLKLASPFDPFPRSIASHHDTLRFAYEWQFLGGTTTGSTVSIAADTE